MSSLISVKFQIEHLDTLVLLKAIMCADSVEVSPPRRYDGYQVYRVTPQNTEQLETLKKLEEDPMDYNFWANASTVGRCVDIMVPPDKKCGFLDFMHEQNIDSELWIDDVQERIENEKRKTPNTTGEYDWKGYQTLSEIYYWMDGMVQKYPGIVRPIIGGKSYEGREIRGVKVAFSDDYTVLGKGRRIVFIEGGIHAREWISPATVTYIVNQLVRNKDPKVRELAESREWHAFPCVNPDGYVYTHTTDRMWRKNRRPFDIYFGVDLNRNWNYHWMDGGSSASAISDNFAGNKPFSEMETRSLANYINNIASYIEVYLAFHSYSQKILFPYGHGGFEKPKNALLHERVGRAAAESLTERHGTPFETGNWAEYLYVSGGVSVDWAKAVHKNIRLAYTYELRDTGRYGFLLPPEQIIPTGRETFDSVMRIFKELKY